MLPLLAVPIIAGAVIGAFADKKKPLRGAALGATAGATGGGLLGVGAGAAAAGGAGAAGAGAAGAGAAGAASAGAAGAGAAGAGAGTAATTAGAAQSGGLLSTMSGYGAQAGQYMKAAQPYLSAANTGMQTAGLLTQGQGAQTPPPMAPMPQGGAQTLGQIAQGAQDPLVARRQQMMAQNRAMWG